MSAKNQRRKFFTQSCADDSPRCDLFLRFAFLRFVRVRDMCASVPLSNPPLECPLPLSRVDITCGSLSWGQPLILPTEAEQPPMYLPCSGGATHRTFAHQNDRRDKIFLRRSHSVAYVGHTRPYHGNASFDTNQVQAVCFFSSPR